MIYELQSLTFLEVKSQQKLKSGCVTSCRLQRGGGRRKGLGGEGQAGAGRSPESSDRSQQRHPAGVRRHPEHQQPAVLGQWRKPPLPNRIFCTPITTFLLNASSPLQVQSEAADAEEKLLNATQRLQRLEQDVMMLSDKAHNISQSTQLTNQDAVAIGLIADEVKKVGSHFPTAV